MNLRSTLSVPIVLAIAASAQGDRRIENGNDSQRNGAWWTETESGGTGAARQGKCTIQESTGKVRITSLQGRGGSAAYQSRWALDWTDGFSVKLEHELRSARPDTASQSATSGIALGFGAFDAAAGYRDGINVQVRRTRAAHRLEMVVRRAGVTVDSASVPLQAGPGRLRLSWTSVGGAVSLDAFVGTSAAPALSIDGLEAWFSAHRSHGMALALLGSSTGNFRFQSSFDDVDVSGDLHDDADDSAFDDDDGVDDDHEDGIYGNDDHRNDGSGSGGGDDDDDGDGDGDDDDDDGGGDDHAGGSLAGPAYSAAAGAARFPVLKADVARLAGAWVLDVREWDAAAGRMVRQWIDPVTRQVLQTQAWVPTAGQLAEWQQEINALPALGVSLQGALSQVAAGSPGANFREVELEVRAGVPWWDVDWLTAAGAHREVRIRAD